MVNSVAVSKFYLLVLPKGVNIKKKIFKLLIFFPISKPSPSTGGGGKKSYILSAKPMTIDASRYRMHRKKTRLDTRLPQSGAIFEVAKAFGLAYQPTD